MGKYKLEKITKNTKKKRPVLTAILLTLTALLLVGVIVGVKFVRDIQNPLGLFNQNTPTPPPIAPTPSASAAPTPSPSPTPDPEVVLLSQSDIEFMKNRVNILLLGIDESTERENWGSFRTDTIIIVSIDFETNKVDMISVPRDSYVKIYTSKGNLANELSPYNKINAAFPKGGGAKKSGYEYTMKTVSMMLGGIPINYYMCVNMNAVKQVVDAMGGVDYDVDVPIHMNGRTLEVGFQHLNGQQVLDYCRMRKADSDIRRIDRQQRMLSAILDQLKTSGQIVNIPQVYTALQANIATNLSFVQISSLALVGLRMDMDQLNRYTIEGRAINVGKASCWAVKANKIEQLVKDVFGVNVVVDPEIDVSAIEAIAAQLALEAQYENEYLWEEDPNIPQDPEVWQPPTDGEQILPDPDVSIG